MNYRNILYFILVGVLSACSESDKPTHLEPHLSTLAATGITRTAATLNGSAVLEGETEMPQLCFRLGKTEGMEQSVTSVQTEGSNVSALLENLTAGTTYYYMLEGSNGRTTTKSNMMNFTTQPNDKPALGEQAILSHGPMSVIIGYEITENGGEPITETGCYYALSDATTTGSSKTKASDSNRQKVILSGYQGFIGQQKLRIGDLQRNSTYQLWPYAKNSVGETIGDAITFTTSDAIMLSEAGELATLMGNHLYEYTSLSVAGALNGDDLACLRMMMGRNPDGTATVGKLTDIDMTDVKVVAGGGPYGASRYTEDHVIGQGLFADCNKLEHVILPSDATTIEKDAFAHCTALESIEISASVTSLLPSSGCTGLKNIQVSKANTYYSSQDGVLLNGSGTEIVWFPMGKTGSYTLPSTITSIGDYAFKECSITQFAFPDGMKDIGQGAFMNSKVEEVKLPASLRTLPSGVFQGCSHLKVVRLGTKAEQICEYAFDGCPLTDIYIDAVYPPVCQENAFSTTDSSNYTATCVLHVPTGKKTVYQKHNMWGKFKNIVEQ